MTEQVTIPRRFNGPPGTGHGGYSSGTAGLLLDGPAEVSLRVPPPLETPLDVTRDNGSVVLRHGDTVVAEARPWTVDLEPPAPLSLEQAEAASKESIFLSDDHPFPTCFACGPRREPGDGLRIFAGPTGEPGQFATPWMPDPAFASDGVAVDPLIVWAAADCPSAAPVSNPGWSPPIVLARFGVSLESPVEPGKPHVIQSWEIERDGRKRHAGVAIFSEGGELRALGRALWISLRES